MKEILLTQGQVALVDDSDYDELSKHKWFAKKDNHTYYAYRNIPTDNGKQSSISMHRHILNLSPRSKAQGDHIDGNGLNNTRENLRIVSCHENQLNRSSHRGSSSKYKGVSWLERLGKWQVEIELNGMRKYLGVYLDEHTAANVYNKAAKEFHGEFARLNEIECKEVAVC